MKALALVAVCAAVIGLVVALILASWIKKSDQGTDRMKEISGFIREGAFAFLKREYKIMAIVIIVLALLIGIGLQSVTTAILYIFGAILSVLAGFFGMNVRTGNRCRLPGSGYCCTGHHRFWIRRFFYGSVRTCRRRYLHQGC